MDSPAIPDTLKQDGVKLSQLVNALDHDDPAVQALHAHIWDMACRYRKALGLTSAQVGEFSTLGGGRPKPEDV